jgi:hypothetical protein
MTDPRTPASAPADGPYVTEWADMTDAERYRLRIEEFRAAIEEVRGALRNVPVFGLLYRPLDRALAWLLPIITFTREDTHHD